MDANEAVFQIDLINSVSADTEEVVDYAIEDEEEDGELPISHESCLLLNQVYIESIDDLKQFLVSKKRENQSRQQELKNSDIVKEVRDVTIPQTGYSHPNSLIPFMAPYFRDVKGLSAPFNEDTLEKQSRGEINVSYVCTNKPWSIVERDKLKELVQQDTVHRLTKPLRDQKEALTKDKLNIHENRKKIEELTKRIEELNSLDPSKLEMPDRWDPSLDWLKFSTEMDTDHNEDDCELYWNNFIHPAVNKEHWTKEEDERLEELVKKHGMHDWDRVAEELATGRLAWQCCQRYQSELNRDVKRVGPLTKAEAELVEKVIEQCRVGDFIPWHQVKYFIEGRTLPQIKHYWNKINVPKRGDIWTDDENRQLSLAVKKYGTHNWRKVATFLPGRSNRQCRERYMMRLNFGPERKLGDWTAQEDQKLLELAPKYNFRWVKMENELIGRNARQIASRYELLMKYQNKSRKNKKDKRNRDKTPLAATRTLTVKNKVFEKIRQLINKEKGVDLDRQLRIGKQKLADKLDKHLKGIPIVTNKGRPKKSNAEENMDTKITELFATFDYKSSPKKHFVRSAQDQCVYNTTKSIFTDQLMGEPFVSDTDLAKAIRLLISKAITSRPESDSQNDLENPQPSTSQAKNNVISPIVIPPNRVTVKGMRNLLMHIEFFTQIVAKSGISLDDLSNALKRDQSYAKIFAQFKSLFYWPALLSMFDPPERENDGLSVSESQSKGRKRTGPRSCKDNKSWLKTDSARMIEIRSNQAKLIQSEMERMAKTKKDALVVENEEPLNDGSTAAPWYITQKQRKYYQLKSLDKSSFVFTRIKPKREALSQSNIERVAESDSETEIENPEQLPEQPVQVDGQEPVEESNSLVNGTEPMATVSEVPIKRKRGRPKKIKTDGTEPEPKVKNRRVTRSSTRGHKENN